MMFEHIEDHLNETQAEDGEVKENFLEEVTQSEF